MSSAETRFLHVANGTCTTDTIKAAGIPGERSIWADPLYEGPVPADLSDSELLEVRGHYLARSMGTGAAWAGPDPAVDPVNDLRAWRAAMAGHLAYDELVLWFEHDLFDQLNLVQLLAWVHQHLPADTPVSLICIGTFPGRPDFKGLGQLTPGELASLFETRQRVGRGQYHLAAAAWSAFRAPTPDSLDALRRHDTSALPHLAPAVSRFLQEYPWTRDGLSRSERRLLELASGNGMALSLAFPRMHDGEETYYITDLSLAALAATLAGTDPPVLTVDVSAAAAAGGLPGRATLTDIGRALLAGECDRIATCGIDRWLGGVHLRSAARIWRWDSERQRVI